MFFLKNKRKKDAITYAGFHDRLMALFIDLLVGFVFFIPVMYFYNLFVYQGETPSILFQEVLQQQEQSPTSISSLFEILFSHPTMQHYFHEQHGILKIILEQILQLSVFFAYLFFFWVYRGTTLGKMFFNMKILDATTMQPASIYQLFIRLISTLLSIAFLFVGFIWIAFDKKKQSWHDKIAHTIVIKQP